MLKKQKGLVLVTGLIFLLIAMLASVSTLENAGILAYTQGNSIEKHRLFYQLEAQLLLLEKNLIENKFYIKDINKIIESNNIKDISTQTNVDFLDELWRQQTNSYLQRNKDSIFFIEYLGVKPLAFNEELISANPINTWIFRFSISSLYEQNYWLQSIIQVYPVETQELLTAQGLYKKNTEHVSKRIAWYERIANE